MLLSGIAGQIGERQDDDWTTRRLLLFGAEAVKLSCGALRLGV